jgi:hypothetical protein
MKTVSIVPTTFAFAASSRVKSEADRAMVANALDRAVCVALSEKYQVVSNGQPSDLIVPTVVADIVPRTRLLPRSQLPRRWAAAPSCLSAFRASRSASAVLPSRPRPSTALASS